MKSDITGGVVEDEKYKKQEIYMMSLHVQI